MNSFSDKLHLTELNGEKYASVSVVFCAPHFSLHVRTIFLNLRISFFYFSLASNKLQFDQCKMRRRINEREKKNMKKLSQNEDEFFQQESSSFGRQKWKISQENWITETIWALHKAHFADGGRTCMQSEWDRTLRLHCGKFTRVYSLRSIGTAHVVCHSIEWLKSRQSLEDYIEMILERLIHHRSVIIRR